MKFLPLFLLIMLIIAILNAYNTYKNDKALPEGKGDWINDHPDRVADELGSPEFDDYDSLV